MIVEAYKTKTDHFIVIVHMNDSTTSEYVVSMVRVCFGYGSNCVKFSDDLGYLIAEVKVVRIFDDQKTKTTECTIITA